MQPSVTLPIEKSAVSPELTIKIHMYPWTTKKDLDKLWNQIILTELEKVNESGSKRARKRATLKSLREQIKRWAEWYQMVEIEGFSLKSALQRWEELHPDEVPLKNIDESTVSKAVAEFRKIITPLADNT